MERGSREKSGDECAISRWKFEPLRRMSCTVLALLVLVLLMAALPARAGSPESSELLLPEAPQPQSHIPIAAPAKTPCPGGNVAKPVALTGSPPTGGSLPPAAAGTQPAPCTSQLEEKWLDRFLTGPEVKPLTPREKAKLAVHNVVDPFNGLTILAGSAISVGSNSHLAYGPGMKGYAHYVGVSYTQDITGEFFGTFLIPSIVHQDPHYHRMPEDSFPRRVGHAIIQTVWTQGDNGKGMVNYGGLVGSAIVVESSDLYVPGEQTNLPATAERYAIGVGTAPVNNFVTEFLPDVARRPLRLPIFTA